MDNGYNEKHYRIFKASSEFFQGFKVNINITKIDILDNIINIFLKKLKRVLVFNNFEVLLDKLNCGKFHIHAHTLEEILTSGKDDILYVCNHC